MKKFLNPSCVGDYLKKHKEIWDACITLNIEMYLLKKIEEFPFNLFGSFFSNPFWNIVRFSLLKNCIVEVHSLINDHEFSYTVKQFRNFVMLNIIDPDEKERVSKELKLLNFDKEVDKISSSIRLVRHAIAHFKPLSEWKQDDYLEFQKISLHTKDVYFCVELIKKFFQILGGEECEYAMLPAEYLDINPNHQTDIEGIFRCVVHNSKVIYFPETMKSSNTWEGWKKSHSIEDLEIFNKWRKKFDLRLIDTDPLSDKVYKD
jgi:hypothetical protein